MSDDAILCTKQMPYGSHTAVDARVRAGLLPPAQRFENGKRGWLMSIVKYCIGMEDKARAYICTEKLNAKGQPSLKLIHDVAVTLGFDWAEVK